MAKKLVPMKDKVRLFLVKTTKKSLTYGELAKAVDSSAMAVGQILKSLGRERGMKQYTNKVRRAA